MESYPREIKKALSHQVRVRLFEEGVPRIKKCLSELTEEEVWNRPNENLVSIGNLVLHLCGNVRQWLVAGLGGREDTRVRHLEFEEKGPIPSEKLIADLEKVMAEVEEVLQDLQPEDLLAIRSVQGLFTESGISILVHVMEHFSYHVGQITWHTKQVKNIDLGYYSGLELGGHG